MNKPRPHTFHIPVLGLGYSIDTPIKVARFGISSVISIMDDELIEKMRSHHCELAGEIYEPITASEDDYRARRITSYLNLVNRIVSKQIEALKSLPFDNGSELVKYFDLLPEESPLKKLFTDMAEETDLQHKTILQEQLRGKIFAGDIDVNIMAKVDNMRFDRKGNELPPEYSDAMAALRGFAESDLDSSVVFSAGYNPRLYSYIEQFNDFFPDEKGNLKKRIILKVSDYRSALVQGKILAKKGIWISEFRVESGLNCGGHAFATDGLLLGPIMEEFKTKREELAAEIFTLCNRANAEKDRNLFIQQPAQRITVQGGIGTAVENRFFIDHYNVNGTGWGSPFLLVPEATNVDDVTLNNLATAKKEDYYLSNASPLGIPFNNFRKSSSEQQRKDRIDKDRPGSPCYKKFLSSDTEFTSAPICTASREYQNQKIKQLDEKNLSATAYEEEFNKITEKDCLCEGLGATALLKNAIRLSHNLKAVTICPGPNLAFFSGIFSLTQMVGHIYGRTNILNSLPRPNVFINELNMYIDYFKKSVNKNLSGAKQIKYVETFKANLLQGIEYYKTLLPAMQKETADMIAAIKNELDMAIAKLASQPVLLPANG